MAELIFNILLLQDFIVRRSPKRSPAKERLSHRYCAIFRGDVRRLAGRGNK
jgi:hypothetical protein